MRALSASELLSVWEQALSQHPVQRGLALLCAASPETPLDALARLSVGRRDACLLTLREWTFGPNLDGLATCPACGERLELAFNVADIRVAPEVEPAEVFTLRVAAYELRFRLPDSLDLAAIAGCQDVAAARRGLLQRCLLAACQDGAETALD